MYASERSPADVNYKDFLALGSGGGGALGGDDQSALITEEEQEKLVQFAKQQKGGLHKIFRKLDKDGSGEIEAREFKALLRKMDVELDDDDVSNLIEALDADGNGALSYAEFVEFASQNRETPAVRAIHKRIVAELEAQSSEGKSADVGVKLAAYDTRKRGTISKADFEKCMKKLDLDLERRDIQTLVEFFDPLEAGELVVRTVSQWFKASVSRPRRSRAPARPRRAQGQTSSACSSGSTRNDGEVSANEFNSAMDQLGLMLTESEVRELSRKYDFNRRGRVNYREVLELAGGAAAARRARDDETTATRRSRARARRPDRVVAQEGLDPSVFEKMDEDRSGAIEKDELRRRCASSRSTWTRTSCARSSSASTSTATARSRRGVLDVRQPRARGRRDRRDPRAHPQGAQEV